MKTVIQSLIISLSIFIISCSGNNNKESTNYPTSVDSEKISNEKTEALSAEFLGNYHGIQPSYFLKNQFGDDMIIKGKKVSIPSIDYKFSIKENAIVNLQQINLDDTRRVYLEGTYKVISKDSNRIKIKCAISDGHNSKPTYFLFLNKNDENGICLSENSPEFAIKKIN